MKTIEVKYGIQCQMIPDTHPGWHTIDLSNSIEEAKKNKFDLQLDDWEVNGTKCIYRIVKITKIVEAIV